jgi:hypothetical protein
MPGRGKRPFRLETETSQQDMALDVPPQARDVEDGVDAESLEVA